MIHARGEGAQDDEAQDDGTQRDGPYGAVAAWLDQLLKRHPQYDADGVLELRERFLVGRRAAADDALDGGHGEAKEADREAASAILSELRSSFFERQPGEIEAALARLDLAKLPDIRLRAKRLLMDETLRSVYSAMMADSTVDAGLARLLVRNVVLPWRERRRAFADFVTARQLGGVSSPQTRRRARAAAKRVHGRYPALEELHGWWLRDVARLPRWNPLRGLFRALRGWALNYLALLWLLMTFVLLFGVGGFGHRLCMTLFQRLGWGSS